MLRASPGTARSSPVTRSAASAQALWRSLLVISRCFSERGWLLAAVEKLMEGGTLLFGMTEDPDETFLPEA